MICIVAAEAAPEGSGVAVIATGLGFATRFALGFAGCGMGMYEPAGKAVGAIGRACA